MLQRLHHFLPQFLGYSKNSGRLYVIGAVCTGYGLYLIKRGIEGDTLMPGTNFTYLPRWLFITTGILMQIPLPAAYFYLQWLESR